MILKSIFIVTLFFTFLTPTYASDYQTLIVQKMNQDRAKQGRSPIQLDAGLSSLAQVRAVETAQVFAHNRPNQKPWHTVFADKGLKTAYAGENIAKKSFAYEVGTDELASVFFELWKNSEGHYQNMVKEEHRYVGIAMHQQDGVYHMVQIFNSIPSSQANKAPVAKSEREQSNTMKKEEAKKKEEKAPGNKDVKVENMSPSKQTYTKKMPINETDLDIKKIIEENEQLAKDNETLKKEQIKNKEQYDKLATDCQDKEKEYALHHQENEEKLHKQVKSSKIYQKGLLISLVLNIFLFFFIKKQQKIA